MSNTKYEFFTYAIRPGGGISDANLSRVIGILNTLSGHKNVHSWTYVIETVANTAGHYNASTRHLHITVRLRRPDRPRFLNIQSVDKEWKRVTIGGHHHQKFSDLCKVPIGYSIKDYHWSSFGLTREYIQDCREAWMRKDKSIKAVIVKRVVVSNNNLTQVVETHARRMQDTKPPLYHVLLDMFKCGEYTFTMIKYRARLIMEYHGDLMTHEVILEHFVKPLCSNLLREVDSNPELDKLLQNHLQVDINNLSPQPFAGRPQNQINLGKGRVESFLGSTRGVEPSETPEQILSDTDSYYLSEALSIC